MHDRFVQFASFFPPQKQSAADALCEIEAMVLIHFLRYALIGELVRRSPASSALLCFEQRLFVVKKVVARTAHVSLQYL